MQSVAVLRQRHLLVRRDPPVWPFMWRGLLPLLGLVMVALFAVGPFARGAIEANVQREIRDQLNASGFGWVRLGVSGQNVTLSGEEPTAGAGERASALARVATCPSWSGRRTCAVNMISRFNPPADLAGAAPQAAAAPADAGAQACERSLAGVLAGEQIEFATGSAAIESRSGPLLDRLARELGSCPGIFRVEGHTDTIGRGSFNRALSEARAAAVRDALIARGIAAERLKAQGFGARRAVGDNSTEAGRARNRRIELHSIPAV
jgi:outer membrane protein OmpA-like peptidoglycan-associated protein